MKFFKTINIVTICLSILALTACVDNQQKEMDLADAYIYAAEVMVENMLARDAEEGIAAFIEKRPPDWRDE